MADVVPTFRRCCSRALPPATTPSSRASARAVPGHHGGAGAQPPGSCSLPLPRREPVRPVARGGAITGWRAALFLIGAIVQVRGRWLQKPTPRRATHDRGADRLQPGAVRQIIYGRARDRAGHAG
ncbi:hypothetical protein QJS66_10440 [Kocuria rhizophila]|nr:hypothetical protein QJS66_10440 [Kocuria rhizophila]